MSLCVYTFLCKQHIHTRLSRALLLRARGAKLIFRLCDVYRIIFIDMMVAFGRDGLHCMVDASVSVYARTL